MQAAHGKARGRRGGAALVEGLIVASLLMLFLAGAVFIHGLYSAKLQSIARAREQAWARALPGCEGGLTSLLLNALTGGAFDVLAGLDAAGVVETPQWMAGFGRGVGAPPAVRVSAPPLIGAAPFRCRRAPRWPAMSSATTRRAVCSSTQRTSFAT